MTRPMFANVTSLLISNHNGQESYDTEIDNLVSLRDKYENGRLASLEGSLRTRNNGIIDEKDPELVSAKSYLKDIEDRIDAVRKKKDEVISATTAICQK
jgi:hypothetical protein